MRNDYAFMLEKIEKLKDVLQVMENLLVTIFECRHLKMDDDDSYESYCDHPKMSKKLQSDFDTKKVCSKCKYYERMLKS